ncbi:MAG: hypothetical protein AAGG75_06240 [Bacteroidota bacterium]
MKKIVFAALFLAIAISTQAQYGINAGYKTMNADKWDAYFGNDDFLQSGFKVGIDYWFRLKKKRIEFTPELSYSRFSVDMQRSNGINGEEFTSLFYSFAFNTNIYPLNFEDDCNCPTFGKAGGILDKGFFIQLSPVVSLIDNRYKSENTEVSTNTVAFGIGGGLGLDIGLNDFTTLTPMVNLLYYPSVEWEGLEGLVFIGGNEPATEGDETSGITQLFVGLKLGIRFDEMNKYGYR